MNSRERIMNVLVGNCVSPDGSYDKSEARDHSVLFVCLSPVIRKTESRI